MATLHKFNGEEIIATELPSLLNQNFDYVNDNRIKTVNNIGYDENNNIDVTHLVTQSIKSGTDLNTLTTSGEYIRLGSVTKLLNSPSDSPFFLTVLASDGLVKQVLTELIANNPVTFTRTMNSAQWSPWIDLTYATQAEAEGGSDNTKIMTPKGVDYRLKKDRQIATYSSLESLGLSPSTATPKDIVEAMPPNSYLSFYASSSVDGQLASLGLPQSSLVVVESGLNDTIPSVFRAYPLLNNQQKHLFVGHYKAYNDYGFTGWTKVLTEESIATQAEAEAGTDSTKVMTPLRSKQLGDKNYLPLSGGLLYGSITQTIDGGNSALRKNMDNNFLQLCGGSSQNNGASLLLFGENYAYSVYGAGFEIRTALDDESKYFALRGKRDGTLTWNGKQLATTNEVAHLLQNNTNAQTIVGYHNSIYRGKYLGDKLTSAQSATIRAGVFDDLFIGDYWTIGGVNYRIAAFDYYYNCGDTACTTHHVVVVPDTVLYSAQMNSSNVVTGAYVGSAMYTTNLATAKTTIGNAFGTDHLLTIRQYFSNAVTGGYESGGAWTDATIWLMNEQNVYGAPVFNNCIQGTSWANRYTIDNSQYPLFAMNPRLIKTRQTYWLRDVAGSTSFALVGYVGFCNDTYSSDSLGVRPAFLVY